MILFLVILVSLLFSIIISIFIDSLIIGFPLPIFTRTLITATCIDSITGEFTTCPQNMMIKNKWHLLNLTIDVIFWVLISIIIFWFRNKLRNRISIN